MVDGLEATKKSQDAVFGSSAEPEKVRREYVSGNVCSAFGLRPVRVLWQS